MRMRKFLRTVHRWIGMLSAVWLLQLATTGLLLQHAVDFKLTTTYVQSPVILKWFDYGQRQRAWDFADETFYQVDDVIGFSGVFLNQAEKVIGVAKIQSEWLVVSTQSIYRYNHLGEQVMQLDSFDGLPEPITQVSSSTAVLEIQSEGQWFTVDFNGWVLPLTEPAEPKLSRSLTKAEERILFPKMLNHRLSYDKVLHGIHSGIKSSSWLNTLSALALFYLCFSGLYLFFKQAKPKRYRRGD